MLNELSWWRAMPIGLSCLLHVGLVTGFILGQQWMTSVVALQPPVLPVQLVTLDAARTLSPIRVLSTVIKAYSPDIAFVPDGSFLVAWHEEQFPFLKTAVQPVRLPKAR